MQVKHFRVGHPFKLPSDPRLTERTVALRLARFISFIDSKGGTVIRVLPINDYWVVSVAIKQCLHVDDNGALIGLDLADEFNSNLLVGNVKNLDIDALRFLQIPDLAVESGDDGFYKVAVGTDS